MSGSNIKKLMEDAEDRIGLVNKLLDRQPLTPSTSSINVANQRKVDVDGPSVKQQEPSEQASSARQLRSSLKRTPGPSSSGPPSTADGAVEAAVPTPSDARRLFQSGRAFEGVANDKATPNPAQLKRPVGKTKSSTPAASAAAGRTGLATAGSGRRVVEESQGRPSDLISRFEKIVRDETAAALETPRLAPASKGPAPAVTITTTTTTKAVVVQSERGPRVRTRSQTTSTGTPAASTEKLSKSPKSAVVSSRIAEMHKNLGDQMIAWRNNDISEQVQQQKKTDMNVLKGRWQAGIMKPGAVAESAGSHRTAVNMSLGSTIPHCTSSGNVYQEEFEVDLKTMGYTPERDGAGQPVLSYSMSPGASRGRHDNDQKPKGQLRHSTPKDEASPQRRSSERLRNKNSQPSTSMSTSTSADTPQRALHVLKMGGTQSSGEVLPAKVTFEPKSHVTVRSELHMGPRVMQQLPTEVVEGHRLEQMARDKERAGGAIEKMDDSEISLSLTEDSGSADSSFDDGRPRRRAVKRPSDASSKGAGGSLVKKQRSHSYLSNSFTYQDSKRFDESVESTESESVEDDSEEDSEQSLSVDETDSADSSVQDDDDYDDDDGQTTTASSSAATGPASSSGTDDEHGQVRRRKSVRFVADSTPPATRRQANAGVSGSSEDETSVWSMSSSAVSYDYERVKSGLQPVGGGRGQLAQARPAGQPTTGLDASSTTSFTTTSSDVTISLGAANSTVTSAEVMQMQGTGCDGGSYREKLSKQVKWLCEQSLVIDRQLVQASNPILRECAKGAGASDGARLAMHENQLWLNESRKRLHTATARARRFLQELGPTGDCPSPDVISCIGEMTVGPIQLRIKPLPKPSLGVGDFNTIHHFKCLLYIDSATDPIYYDMYKTHTISYGSGVASAGVRGDLLEFNHYFVFRNVRADFRLHLEIFWMEEAKTAGKLEWPSSSSSSAASSSSKGSNKGSNKGSSKKLRLRKSKHQSLGGPDSVEVSLFRSVASIELGRDDAGQLAHPLSFRVPHSCPLHGSGAIQMNVNVPIAIQYDGFLTMFRLRNDSASWDRRYGVLNGKSLSLWRDPDDVEQKPAIFRAEILPTALPHAPDRSECCRPNTFVVYLSYTELRGRRGAGDRLESGEGRFLLSADSRDSFDEWQQAIGRVVQISQVWSSLR